MSIPSTRLRTCGLLAGVTLSFLLLLSACGTLDGTLHAPPVIEGASFVGNGACAECHADYTRVFAGSAHGRFHREDRFEMTGQTGCESCHGPGSRHVAAAGERALIVNPRRDPATCFQCHLSTHAEFNLPQHHPLLEGRLSCGDCHDAHGHDIRKPAGGLAMARLNQSCSQCHRDQTRPFVFEHEAMREGCTTCHHPHGSFNSKLIVQRDANLCLKCHAQVQQGGGVMIGKTDHRQLLPFGSCWSAGCHTAPHGSNINPKMLY